METEIKEIGVQLGRFAPYHRGHEKLTQALIDRFGIENSLILAGSSNNFNWEKTPFTYEQRAEMIRAVFPNIKIEPLPDSQPQLATPDLAESSLDRWLKQIHDLQKEMRAKFVFVSASKSDIHFLEPHFETEILIDRNGDGISATDVREQLITENRLALKEILHPEVTELALQFLEENKEAFKE